MQLYLEMEVNFYDDTISTNMLQSFLYWNKITI